ncbi:MAG TPA: hypothetical protein VGH43_01445 [Jatrophihabitans sp.]|jgi:hypothetical protein
MGNQRNPSSLHSRRRIVGIVGMAAVLIAAAALSPVLSWHFGYLGLVLGLVAALIGVGAVGAPTALRPGRVDGSVDVLRRLRGWHVVDAVEIDGVLIDHVVVAPAAVLAVVSASEPDLAATGLAAQKVRRLVRTVAADDVAVVPIAWVSPTDGTAKLARAHRVVSGVHVVDGTDPVAWLHVFRDVRFEPGQRLELCVALEARAAEHRTLAVTERVVLLPPPEPAGA